MAHEQAMNTSPLSNQFGPRLQMLDREIQDSLSEVRRHIRELEKVEQQPNEARFADLLEQSIEQSDPPRNSQA